jgi:hypothetical protein
MTSIYQRALGSDFGRLHPKIQQRFGFCGRDRVASIGHGVMDEVWHGPAYILPFLYVGAWRRIMFPEQGRGVPFTVENYAYVDRFGRETVTWIRTFRTRRSRRFDAYMIYSDKRGCIVDYLGTHQHLAVDLSLCLCRSTPAEACDYVPAISDFTSGWWASAFPWRSRALPTFANGSMSRRGNTALKSTFATDASGRYLVIAARSTRSGESSTTAPSPLNLNRTERNTGNDR